MTTIVELPEHAVEMTRLAQRMVEQHEAEGGNVCNLFAAFAGLVTAVDEQVGMGCIRAFELMLEHEREVRH